MYFIVVVIYGYLERDKNKVFRFHMNISSFFEISAVGCLSDEIVVWFSCLVKLFSRTCLHWKCLCHNDIEICNLVCLQEFNVYWYYIAKSWKILNYIKRTLFDCLNPLAHFYWKWLVIIKSITHFFPKNGCLICRHSSQRTLILITRYYIARDKTTMSYTKKSSFLLPCIFFHREYLIR